MSVFDRIIALLNERGITYDLREHAAVTTSLEAAAARGCELRQGAKSLVCHVDKTSYVLAVLSASRQAALLKLAAHLGARKVRLCTPEEVLRQTQCTIGSVPPFGSMLGLPTFVDPSLGENATIAFNPGSHTHSILMRYEDYVALEEPTIVAFAAGVIL